MMNDKVFFQFVAVIALIVMLVFLFWDSSKTLELGVSGGIFVLATVLSLSVGRSNDTK
jgi:hypothetical protein